MASIEDLKQLAAQLASPTGTTGKEIAQMMDRTNSNMTAQAIDSLFLKSGQYILELGHGNAGHVAALLRKHPGIHYTGLDISETMVQEAINNNSDAVANKVASFHWYDGMTFPFPEKQFDGIFLVNTIYFIEEPVSFLQNLARILRPGGRLAITFATRSFMESLPFTAFGFTLYDESELRDLADDKLLHYMDSYHGQEVVISKTGDRVNRHYITIVWTKK